jgi:hypothetical protein
VRKVIEEISDRVIEKGRLAFAAKAGVSAARKGRRRKLRPAISTAVTRFKATDRGFR